jgi:phosphoserine phosphatase RsbU/P
LLALFSDGLAEANDLRRQEFGTRRLENVLRDHAHRSPSEIIDEIFRDIGKFEQGRPPLDDQTLLVIKTR